MCNHCFEKYIRMIDGFDQSIKNHLNTLICNNCKTYYSFLLSINQDCKVFCLTKMKNYDNPSRKVKSFEKAVKEKILHKLQDAMEILDTNHVSDVNYLNTSNELKEFYDLMDKINAIK